MIGNISRVAVAVGAAMLMLIGALAVPSQASAASTDLSGQLLTEQGPTTILGGGDHFFVKFGADAAFGIVWGTNDTPNNVYFVAIKARYLGMAQVYDSSGNLVKANDTLKIYTLYAVKLEDILEFNDVNHNGTLQYKRVYNNGNFTGNYLSLEPLYKKVDLKTAWTQSKVSTESTNTTRTWTFSLTARNLLYAPLANYTGATGDNEFNNLTLTFHLRANMVQVDNATIPQWRITVTKGMMGRMMWFTNAERAPDVTMSGKFITYNVKWDSSFEGWDFDAANANPALVMEFSAIVGNYIPPAMASWMEMSVIRSMNEYGVMRCGQVTEDGSGGAYMRPRMVTTPSLTFDGGNSQIGRFEWVSNVMVDGIQEQLHAQLLAGVPVTAIGANGAIFHGFAVIGGISYPGGNLIIHDPTFSSDALIDLGSSTRTVGGILFLAFIVAVVVIVVAVVIALTEKKPGQKAPQTYERSKGSQPGEWTKYYDKK